MDRPNLYQVLPTNDYNVYLYYDNGEIKQYDCSFILDNEKLYNKIININDFKRLCTIMNKTLAFDISENFDPYNCIDFCPDTVYNESVKIPKERDLLA